MNVCSSAAETLPAGTIHAVSYASGRMTIELAGLDETGVRGVIEHLQQSGLSVDPLPASRHVAGAAVVLTVRPS